MRTLVSGRDFADLICRALDLPEDLEVVQVDISANYSGDMPTVSVTLLPDQNQSEKLAIWTQGFTGQTGLPND